MAPGAGRFLRDHAVLVAAALPLVVVGFFLLSTAIPRFTVPPPAYDVLLRTGTYDQTAPSLAVDFTVRDERVYATVRPIGERAIPARASLWLLDHATMTVRQVPVELPEQLTPDEAVRTTLVTALAGRRVVAQATAPDGYALRNPSHGSPGIVGNLFGMGRSGGTVSLVKRGRVIPIALPSPYEHESPTLVGWLTDEGGR